MHILGKITRCLIPAILLGALWTAAPGRTISEEIASQPVALPEKSKATAVEVLETYCISCHGTDKQKGDVRFDALEAIDTVDLQSLFVKVQEVVHFEEMPPSKAKQPTEAERAVLLDWLKEQITGEAAEKLAEKLRRPESGNYVNHNDLFSGKHANLPGFTYDRRWLISQYIFDAKFNRLLNFKPSLMVDGKRENVIGNNNRPLSLTNPFLLPTSAGVRYYANETLNGGHLLTMLTNAKGASDYMMSQISRNKQYLPAASEIMAMEEQSRVWLASRKRFLETHIDTLLCAMYGDDHQALLPAFVGVEVPPPLTGDAVTKKAPFHAAHPGNAELELIFRSFRRNHRVGQSDAELIEACEREWFKYGHAARQIQVRLTFLQNYLEDFRQQIISHDFDKKMSVIEYRPLADGEMQVVTETIRSQRSKGDSYRDVIAKCMAHWEAEAEKQRLDAGPPSETHIRPLVDQLFIMILERSPSDEERDHYGALARLYSEQLGREPAIKKLIQTLMLNTEFVYRNEFGQGEPDEFGRRMMSPRDASYAIAYALTDSSPDTALVKAAQDGRLNTRADYEREVRRLLARRDQVYIIDEAVSQNDVPNFTRMPIRELRFIRDFFGYPNLLAIFKDRKRFGAEYDQARVRLVEEADALVEHILEHDKEVFTTLLTTDKFYVFHSGDNEAMQASSERIRKIYDYFKDKGWQDFEVADLVAHKEFIGEMKMRGIDVSKLEPGGRYNPLGAFKQQMESFTLRLEKGQTAAAPYVSFPAHGMANASTRTGGRLNSPEVAQFFNIDMFDWDYPTTQPTKITHRKGMLTHPAWLIAFAQNTETDPIHRGKWVREKLLAGTIPDVPITVDAVIPENPHMTMRQRLDDKTNNDYCMSCHVKMNPVGLPFEMYDDFGRFRIHERLEYPENLITKVKDKGRTEEDLRDIYKTLPVDPSGFLEGTGDPTLDGEVSDALDMIDRLAKSDRVRQSIIRHAFRYFMGRNELLSDSKTLIDADRAYLASGGSYDELIVALLTSDSFIYRKLPQPKDQNDGYTQIIP